MKKRQGFVSNSSSSSFILILDGKPKDMYEIHTMLFGSNENQLIIGRFNDSVESIDIAAAIFNEISSSGLTTLERLADEFRSDWCFYTVVNDIPRPKYSDPDYIIKNHQFYKELRREAMKQAKTVMESHLDKWITIVEFEDDTLIGYELEHGPTLIKSEYCYKVISHH